MPLGARCLRWPALRSWTSQRITQGMIYYGRSCARDLPDVARIGARIHARFEAHTKRTLAHESGFPCAVMRLRHRGCEKVCAQASRQRSRRTEASSSRAVARGAAGAQATRRRRRSRASTLTCNLPRGDAHDTRTNKLKSERRAARQAVGREDVN